MRVLVTGANGFVGPHLMRELASAGHEVIAAIQADNVPRVNVASEYVVAELTNPEDVAKIDFTKIDGIVHLAGLAAVGPSFSDPLKYYSVNMGAETLLFEEVLRQNAKPRVIVVSSATLYDPRAELPFTEETCVLPNSPYAVSKLGQEHIAEYYAQRGLECIVARPFNHIGPGQGPGFLIADLAKQVAEAEKSGATEIAVGNLEARRDYTDVRDIVHAYRLLLESGTPGRTYNICSGLSHSGNEILEKLLAKSTAKLEPVQDPERMRPSDFPELRGDHGLLTTDTGWEPSVPLESSLTDALETWRQATA